MKIPKLVQVAGCLAVVGLLGLSQVAQAGNASWDFTEDPVDLELYGTDVPNMWQPDDGNPGGFLALTYPIGSQSGTVIFPDIDNGDLVTSFTLAADIRSGNSSGDRAADGWAVSFARANDPFLASVSNGDLASGLPEAGTTTGVVISFDTWQGNALPDTGDIEGLIIRVDNVTIHKEGLPTRHGECDDATSLQTGPRDLDFWATGPTDIDIKGPEGWDTLCWQPLIVEVNQQSQVSVTWKGVLVLDNFQTDYFPSIGQLVLTGRTGGANSQVHFDNVTLDTTTLPPDNVPPSEPGPITVADAGGRIAGGMYEEFITLEWGEATDDSGGLVAYELQRDGVTLADTIVGLTYTDNTIVQGVEYTYRVRAKDLSLNTSGWVSTTATYTDTTPPTLTTVSGDASFTTVNVGFSEPVDPATAGVAGNYTIEGLTVSNPILSGDAMSVALTTSQQTENVVYTVVVNNVADPAGNVIAADSSLSFNSYMFMTGVVAWERWAGGGGIVDFINDYRAGDVLGPPSVSWTTTLFESGRDLGNDYRGRGVGWFTAPATGDYRFMVTVDDNARVFVSTDDDPANVLLTVAEGGWSNNRDWENASQEQDSETWVEALGTPEYNLSEWQDFPIPLVQGERYFIEAFWQEGGGGDGLEFIYTDFGAPVPANGTPSNLEGDLIGSYVDPSKLAPILISPTGQTAVTIEGGTTGTLSVVADLVDTYQWSYNGVDIPDGTSADLVIEDAQAIDSGAYRCLIANPNGSILIQPIHVMVTAEEVFAIEAEDFDYDGGQNMPAASVMPYLGGAYDGLSANHGIDYNSSNGSGDSPLYRAGAVIEDGTAMPMGQEDDPGGQYATTRLGAWTMTTNFKCGWIGGGDWGNYTRTFPEPAQTYWVLAASSQSSLDDGAISGSLGVVSAGVGTADQTVDLAGNFLAPGTGAWSRNSLVPMTDDNGAIATIQLGGETTIRWNYDGGDAEYLVFTPATVAPGTGTATITISDGNVVIAEEPPAGSTVQSAATIDGPWTDVGAAPQTVPVGTDNQYFRLSK